MKYTDTISKRRRAKRYPIDRASTIDGTAGRLSDIDWNHNPD
jgi:hypothetical protein